MESLNKNQYCPVCGYNLGFAAWDNDSASHEICPCCGIQYGYDDMGGGDLKKRHEIYENWKKKWIIFPKNWKTSGRN